MSSDAMTPGDIPTTPKKQRKSAAGRKLVRWNPDLDQLTLLAVESVSAKLGVAVPWEAIAKEVAPHLTGEAIKQHLAKVLKFRETYGKKVPSKVERHERRKSSKATGVLVTPTAAKRGAARSKKNVVDEDDDEDDDVEPKPIPGGNLLWFSGKDKKKAATTPAKTPSAGRGRKGKSGKDAQVEQTVLVKFEEGSDGEMRTPTKRTSAGIKRARATKPTSTSKTDVDAFGSPKKKAKKTGAMAKEVMPSAAEMRELEQMPKSRTTKHVDYSKQMELEEDDEDDDLDAKDQYEVEYDEDDDDSGSALVKTESHSPSHQFDDYIKAVSMSQGANTQIADYQYSTPATTPGYVLSGAQTPFDQSPSHEQYNAQIWGFDSQLPATGPPVFAPQMSMAPVAVDGFPHHDAGFANDMAVNDLHQLDFNSSGHMHGMNGIQSGQHVAEYDEMHDTQFSDPTRHTAMGYPAEMYHHDAKNAKHETPFQPTYNGLSSAQQYDDGHHHVTSPELVHTHPPSNMTVLIDRLQPLMTSSPTEYLTPAHDFTLDTQDYIPRAQDLQHVQDDFDHLNEGYAKHADFAQHSEPLGFHPGMHGDSFDSGYGEPINFAS